MKDYTKYTEMKKMFYGKSMIIAKVQPFAKTQIVTVNVHVVDVNVTTRSKATKEQVFKERTKENKEC